MYFNSKCLQLFLHEKLYKLLETIIINFMFKPLFNNISVDSKKNYITFNNFANFSKVYLTFFNNEILCHNPC